MLSLTTRQQIQANSPTKSSIYDYDARIHELKNSNINSKRNISKKSRDHTTIHDLMLCPSMAKATRHKHLQTILNLIRYLKKDWDVATANDIGKLVVEIVRRYANDNGQETYTSYDHKKILKIFYRWFKP